MKFRSATKSDAASLAAISIEVWIGTYIRNGVNGFFADYALNTFTPANFEHLLNDPKEIFIVSENIDGIDGFIRLSLDKPGPVKSCSDTEITTLYVQPRHHGKGLGRALLTEGLQRCQNLGKKAVWLTTNSENIPAIKFYDTLGFNSIGTTYFRIQDQSYLNKVFTIEL